MNAKHSQLHQNFAIKKRSFRRQNNDAPNSKIICIGPFSGCQPFYIEIRIWILHKFIQEIVWIWILIWTSTMSEETVLAADLNGRILTHNRPKYLEWDLA